MTKDEISKINMVRLTEWQQVLKEKHATAFILVGVGHDKNSGQVTVLVPEDIASYELRGFLEKALTVFDETP